jgi:hypothetical protein
MAITYCVPSKQQIKGDGNGNKRKASSDGALYGECMLIAEIT